VLKGLALVVVVLAALGFFYEQIGRSQESRHLFRIGRAVDVGGRTLNIDCSGSGSPAVILESGGGGYGGYGWREVQAEVASFTTVCWYDRAGEGWSDPSPTARRSASIVNDLHHLLQLTPVPAPYVLVGHSIGGEYIRTFTGRFPSEVSGLVLVDSTHPEQREPAMMLSPIAHLPVLGRRLLCLVLPVAGRFGVIRFAMRNVPVNVPQQFAAEQSAVTSAIRNQRVKGVQTEAAQGCTATQGGVIRPDRGSGNPEVDQAATSAGGLGNRPLIVLTAGKYWKPADPVAAREIAEFHEVWVHQLQSDLANLSTDGKQLIVESSDHAMPEQAPEVIASAVKEVVMKLRQRGTNGAVQDH
jgi:pimeloyl-ACP methyl ester carboxylesterase